MSKNTKNYGLFEYEPEKDGAQTFNIQSALNENWDRIDEALAASDPTKADAKEAPADADGVMIADSEAASGLKRLSWTAVKTALGRIFVPLARKINGKTLEKDVTLTAEDVGAVRKSGDTMTGALGLDGSGNVYGFEDTLNRCAYIEASSNATQSIRMQLWDTKGGGASNAGCQIWRQHEGSFTFWGDVLHTGISFMSVLTPTESTPDVSNQVFWQYG